MSRRTALILASILALGNARPPAVKLPIVEKIGDEVWTLSRDNYGRKIVTVRVNGRVVRVYVFEAPFR